MKRSFFRAAVVSVLIYGYTTWTLTKRMEKKLDGNYTRILRAILNKSWKQHPTKQQLYADEPNIQDIAVEVGRSSQLMYICGSLHMNAQRQDVQLEPTHNSSVLIQDVALRTCRKQWTMGRCDERGPENTRAYSPTWWRSWHLLMGNGQRSNKILRPSNV